MRKKTILIPIAVAAVLLAAAGILRLIGSPAAGERACAKLGIPRHPVIAHRGASYYAPEETAQSFMLARDLGADYIELDVQRTRDGEIVAFHDDTPLRTTNAGELYPGRENNFITTFTLQELKALDAGSWFNKRFPERARREFEGARILTLEETIAIVKSGGGSTGLYIETKEPKRSPGIERQLVDLLVKTGWMSEADMRGTKSVPARVIFQSFDINSLAILRSLAPNIPRVYLIDEKMEKETGWNALLDRAAGLGAGIGPVGYLGYPGNIGKAHRRGMCVHIYTINVKWQMYLFAFFGADGFFSDRCDLVMDFYGRRPRADIAELLDKYARPAR